MRSHFAECMYEQGKINCGASPQADLIQNYFLWKRMFRKQNFRQNKGTFGTKTLVLALLDPFLNLFKENFFLSTCGWNLSSHFLSLSPLPLIPDARMSQFVLPCVEEKYWEKNDLPIILAQKSSKFNIKAFV